MLITLNVQEIDSEDKAISPMFPVWKAEKNLSNYVQGKREEYSQRNKKNSAYSKRAVSLILGFGSSG